MAGVIRAAGTVLCLTISNTLIGAFTDNAETIAAGGAALRIISAGFIVSTVSVTASGALEGIGMGVQSLVISLLRYIVVILPSAFILCHLFGGGAVWNAFWITEFAAAVVAEIVYRGTIKRTMPKPRSNIGFSAKFNRNFEEKWLTHPAMYNIMYNCDIG